MERTDESIKVYLKINDDLKNYKFLKVNRNLRDFTQLRCQISGSTLPSMVSNQEDLLLNALYNEIFTGLIRQVNKGLLNTEKFDYTISSLDPLSDIFFDIIRTKDYSNIIVSSQVGASIQDHIEFNFYPVSSVKSNACMYAVGQFCDKTVWVDPYMKWTDGRVILFNDVDFNLGELYINDVANSLSFTNKIEISLKYSLFSTTSSEVLYVVSGENDPNYLEYIRLRRDIRIDKIL